MSDRSQEATIERLTKIGNELVSTLKGTKLGELLADAYRSGLEAGISQERERCAKWISVEEKLPRPQQFVLAYYAADDIEVTWHTGEVWSPNQPGKPTHWMPLPQPPAAIRNPEPTEATKS